MSHRNDVTSLLVKYLIVFACLALPAFPIIPDHSVLNIIRILLLVYLDTDSIVRNFNKFRLTYHRAIPIYAEIPDCEVLAICNEETPRLPVKDKFRTASVYCQVIYTPDDVRRILLV